VSRTSINASLDEELQVARNAAAQNRLDEADAAFTRVLELEPTQLEALNYSAQRALLAGQAQRAIELLERATAVEANNAELWKNLGLARIAAGAPQQARANLRRATEVDPNFFSARLFLAQLDESGGRQREALTHYFRAILSAQAQGRWLSDETTAPGLRERVKHAMRFVAGGRRQLFLDVLQPLRTRSGDAALERVMNCLDIYLGDAPAAYPDARQRPKFLYFPGLPTSAYLEHALFPWYAQLEDNFQIIREELFNILRDAQGIVPFLGDTTPEQTAQQLAGSKGAPTWDAFFFYRHGKRMDENCARCPRTAAILDALPLVRIREHAPEICFSVLTPGTHILPHRGVTNTRVVTHFPLVVPEECALNVGGELRAWEPGHCFTFDDTFEHEAWNRGESNRVVMLMDCWNPYLTAIEREAVTELVAAIGDFNRECGIAVD
jgi:aspartate beta-hydroxylase